MTRQCFVFTQSRKENVAGNRFTAANVHMIDKAKGMAYVANDEELYLEVLGDFVDDADMDISEITEKFEEKNWPDYIVLVHALKSVCATIGALELSERAKKHEFAGKEDRISEIEEDFEGLIKLYRDTVTEIKKMLE